MSIGQDLLNVPMGDMIREMAFAIADSQYELDLSSVHVAELMGGLVVKRDENNVPIRKGGKLDLEDTRVYFGRRTLPNGQTEPEKLSLLELGFTPNFYQFVDTLIEVKIAIKMTSERAYERKTKGVSTRRSLSLGLGGIRYSVTSTPVDATYSSKYSYSAEGSSLLRTKLQPVPPPAILEERIREQLAMNQAEHESGD